MKDEEFVKLKHWVDAEFTIIHIWLAVIVGFLVDHIWSWILIGIYIVFSILYAATRIAYVESKHKGYMQIPRRDV